MPVYTGEAVSKKSFQKTSETMAIPLTVAGGIRTVEDVTDLLRAGADKVAINTAAVSNPRILTEAARVYGVTMHRCFP